MFKHVGLLVRKDGLTHKEFTDYWQETHADIAKEMEGVIRYQQVHAIDPQTAPCDGLAELYFETFEELTAALGVEGERDFDPDLPRSARAREDAYNFLQIPDRPKIVGQEVVERNEVDWETEGLVKVSTFLVRDEELTHQEFLDRWETQCVPRIEESPRHVRHAQVIPNDPNISEFDCVVELYFEDSTDVPESLRLEDPPQSEPPESDQLEDIPPVTDALPLESTRQFVGVEHIQKDDR